MGRVAGGEGVLGLQRAFQVAGVRTTVTSLWQVSDEATRLLMQRFYDNLWDKGLPRGDALRQAQLWLMRKARLGRAPEGDDRGLDLPEKGKRPERLSPHYWAGFVLSGDWR